MKFKLKPFFKDILLTSITQAIILISFFLVYKLIARNFGPEGMGEYALIRKIAAFLSPFLSLGLGVGIPRYIAISRNKEERSGYIKAGGLTVGLFVLIFLIFINLFKESFAEIFFGTTGYVNLVLPLSFFLAGLILHTLIYSYFRGRLLVKTFNVLQIINLALVPVVIFIFFGVITIEKLITLIGIATFLIAFLFSLVFIKEFFSRIQKWQFKKSLNELLKYGLPRVPGDFALAGLLSLGPIFAAHFVSIQEVGYLSLSQSLVSTIGTVIAPLGLILLPKVSNLIANGKEEIIKENLNLFIPALIQCSIFLCFQLIIFADVVIKFWLGPEFLATVLIMRIMFISLIFYPFYVGMRSILDAVKVKPLNTINIFISFVVFLIVSGSSLFLSNFISPAIILAVAFTSGLVCLGVLTYISIKKIYPEAINKDFNYLWIAISINILLGGIAISAKSFVISRLYYLIFFEALVSVIYLSILWFLRMGWIREIPKRIRIRD
jgi:O-antigen/teichoic acid export membrane protein